MDKEARVIFLGDMYAYADRALEYVNIMYEEAEDMNKPDLSVLQADLESQVNYYRNRLNWEIHNK